jgi:hypothetical protein
MPFAASACLFAIINLGSVFRLVGCALLGNPKMKRRPWQVVICCICRNWKIKGDWIN